MDEYVEREALNALLLEECSPMVAAYLIDAAAAIPAADVRPVVRGKWLRTPTYWAYCSVCGEEPPDETNTTTNFCPNCGADMRQEPA